MVNIIKDNKILIFIEKWLPVIIVVAFTLHYTVLKYYFNSLITDIKTLSMLLYGVLFVINAAIYIKYNGVQHLVHEKKFCTMTILLAAFFLIRAITIITSGFDLTVIKEVVFEGIFLVAICSLTVTRNTNFILIARVFVSFVFILNVLNIFTYWYSVYFSYAGGELNSLILFLWKFNPIHNSGIIFTNMNTGGILTGIALLLSLLFVRKEKKMVVLIVVMWVIDIYSMYILSAKSSYVAFFVCIIAMFILTLYKKSKPHKMVLACLICCLLVFTGVITMIAYNLQDSNTTLSGKEQTVDSILSGRYQIWQDALIANQEDLLLGVGSYEREFDNRKAYIYETRLSDSENKDSITIMHLHNGYLGVFVYAGMIAAIIFFLILGSKICFAKTLRLQGEYRKKSVIFAGILIYLLIINLIEPYFIGKRHIEFLFMMMILAWDMPNEGKVIETEE